MYDVVIIGSGPAGMSAAIYCARAGLHSLLIEAAFSGGQMANAFEIDNYAGFPGINGADLAAKMEAHVRDTGVERLVCRVESAELGGEVKRIRGGGRVLESRTVIITAGSKRRKLGLENEEKLTGAGISYCATCDGGFFRGRTVAVVGGGNSALEDALYLSGLCKKVYVVYRRDVFRGFRSTAEKVMEKENVEVLFSHEVTAVTGAERVEKITVLDRKSAASREIAVEGLFIAVGAEPASDIFAGELTLDKAGYIVAGEDCKTDLPGVFAAGDVRTKPLRQIITAAADGAVASAAALEYINSRASRG